MFRFLKHLCGRQMVFANVAEGTHAGRITRQLENAISTRHLLGKQGTASNQIDVCDASDLPLGVITDTGSASDLVNVDLLGQAPATVLMVANQSISAGADVYAAASGKVTNRPVAAGTYYMVGRALTEASGDGATFEVVPIAPLKSVVIAAFTGNATTDTASLGTALALDPDKIMTEPQS
ncbi:MAG: capsid cement protein [Verrucomicrobiota bacterium]